MTTHPDILDILRQDYQRFPAAQTYSIYAEDVFFQDPLNQFSGVQRYQQMIDLIQTWFRNTQMELYEMEKIDPVIHTRWRLSWQAPLPWQPQMTITGRSQLTLNSAGLICRHIDVWDCSRLDVVKQLLPRTNSQPPR